MFSSQVLLERVLDTYLGKYVNRLRKRQIKVCKTKCVVSVWVIDGRQKVGLWQGEVELSHVVCFLAVNRMLAALPSTNLLRRSYKRSHGCTMGLGCPLSEAQLARLT